MEPDHDLRETTLRPSLGPDLGGRRLRVSSDWRFDLDDVLDQAARHLVATGLKFGWTEDSIHPLTVVLTCAQATLRWRFSTVQGLMMGVNEVLDMAGNGCQFVGLESGGDEYFFVFCQPPVVKSLLDSPLFKVWIEADKSAGPV